MKDFVAIANQYIADVLSGAIVANKWTKAACQRQLDDLARQDSPEWGYFFDVQAATDVCDFLELLQSSSTMSRERSDLAPPPSEFEQVPSCDTLRWMVRRRSSRRPWGGRGGGAPASPA